MYDTLVGIDPEGNIIPSLAESWSVSDDGVVWTFNLRKGLKFHNGEEVTSADVKHSLERHMGPASRSPWGGQFRATIGEIELPDPYTVVINTKKISHLFYTIMMGGSITPKAYIEEHGDEYFNQNPIGTGPWKLVKLTPGVSIELEANKDHHRYVPAFEKLIVELVPEESTRIAKLKRGEIDITSVSMDRAVQLQKEGYEMRTLARPSNPIVAFSNLWDATGPTSDIRVRQALSLAINRPEIAEAFFQGLAEPWGVLWTAETSWGFDPAWKEEPYDPVKAQSLLKQAGYPGSFENPEVKLYSHAQVGAGWLPDFAQIIAGYWEAIGVKTRIVPIESGKLRGKIYTDPPDPTMVGSAWVWFMPTMPVSLNYLESAYKTGVNWRLVSDPEWDALYDSVHAEPNETKRIELFRELVKNAHDRYVCLGVSSLFSQYAVSDKIGEWTQRTEFGMWSAYVGVQHK